VYVGGFYMDKTDVTNAEFAEFVTATGLCNGRGTQAVRDRLSRRPSRDLVGRSAFFAAGITRWPLNNHFQWWSYVQGAILATSTGSKATYQGRHKYPVVHIALRRCRSVCEWAGKRLPTEAEWEFAARGGLGGKPFVWGDAFRPSGKWMAIRTRASFRYAYGDDGYRIAPVAQYPPNGYGLYDMAGQCVAVDQ